MRNVNNTVRRLSCLSLLAGAMLLAGCTDDNYDLGDLDLNIGIGNDDPNGLRLPGDNSVREIHLSDVLDIDNSDVIVADANGNYVFAKGAGEGDVTPAHPRVNIITVSQSTRPDDYSLNISELEELAIPAATPESMEDAAVQAIWDGIDAQVRSSGRISLFHMESMLPEEVVNLQSVVSDAADGQSRVSFQLRFSPHFAALVSQVASMELTVPSYLEYDVTATSGQVEKTATGIRLTNVPTTGADVVIQLRQLKDFNQTTTSDASYLVTQPAAGQMQLLLQGDINLDMLLSKADMSQAVLSQHLKDKKHNGTSYSYQIDNQTHISDIVVNQATGFFKPEIDLTDGIGEVKIENLPDFLDDDEVRLVVDNPQIGISIGSDADVAGVLSDVRLVALGAVQPNGERQRLASVTLPQLRINAHKGAASERTMTHILVHDAGKTAVFDDQHPDIYGGNIVEPIDGKLSDLLNKIPEVITFECNASADETLLSTVQLGYDYTIQPVFDFWAPLAFNAGSVIVYRDTIDGWHGDLEDIKLTDGAYIDITADVTNRVPAGLTVHADAVMLNNEGKLVKMGENMVKVTVETPNNGKGNLVEAGSESAPKTTRLHIRIDQKNKQAIPLLDGIIYRAVAQTPADSELQGKALNKTTQTLRVENITPVLHGRVIYNLDD